MRILSLAFLLSFASIAAYSQNHVTNGDFEDVKEYYCWYKGPDFRLTAEVFKGWSSPKGRGANFFSNALDPECVNYMPSKRYPNNFSRFDKVNYNNPKSHGCSTYGGQVPHSGSTTGGVLLQGRHHDWRQCLQNKLKEPLVPGKKYLFKCYLSQADYAQFEINKLEVCLAREQVFNETQTALVGVPEVHVEGFTLDDEEWTEVSVEFFVRDTMNYMLIGLFDDYTNDLEQVEVKTFRYCKNISYYAFVFIDDVSIEPVDDEEVELIDMYKDIHHQPLGAPFAPEVEPELEEVLATTEDLYLMPSKKLMSTEEWQGWEAEMNTLAESIRLTYPNIKVEVVHGLHDYEVPREVEGVVFVTYTDKYRLMREK